MKQYTIVNNDGFRVAVTEGGRGIPLVFIHGLSVSAAAYTEMLELLADNGFHVFAFDAPDHGGSDSLPWGHTVKDMAEVIEYAMDQIPALWGESVVIVGHSMGGWIAAELAAAVPSGVDTLILLDAAVGEEFHESIRLQPKKGLQFLAGAVKDVLGDVRKAGSIRQLGERLSLIGRLSSSVSGPGIARAIYAMIQGDSAEALRKLRGTVRTIIVHGSEDGIIPWKAAYSASNAARCTISCLIGRYHSWMISDPELALSVIRAALYLTPSEPDDREAA
ncbi:alpha/beta fold hydrolase [Mycobacterium intracellulare]|uniref:Alpha/beta hydrolase n=1 Tax=Mycobacterium intracellulare TaxID=1767 RepID=A0AAE4R876_MYCIT|nr:alpha/beta hydrolase [Mycobacterium intracellulare]MDV6975297.1 alpha/beta hydrolase [Mycobacterium intracellulare]MDV6980361.1 alpha/beta hydrolase [Mycobacterium intracellulare]MDV7010790.1 alpha/beta hydrolase [Mycobacterium intracellulare]MDV7025696.1 alpha/beta hydrolase [Mycobacterium intracellulare]